MTRTFAVVTGGGTAGHVLPALAIMDRLVARGVGRDEVHHVGTTRGIEATMLPASGHAHTLLRVDGLQRSLRPRALARTLLAGPKLLAATWRAIRLLGRLRPSVVVNVGGYASLPATIAAIVRRVPVVVVSYDRRPGLASRVTGRFAVASACAFDGSPLPRARPTGAPLRPEVLAVDRARDRDAARATLDLPPDRFVVTVFGGSLGATAINDAVADLVGAKRDDGGLCIHHVTGPRWRRDGLDIGEDAGASPVHDGIMYRVIAYDDRMPLLYAASDLMVTRAGASTIAELAATGTPAVVVPWPDAAEDHQTDNARTLSDHGAAILLEQRDLSAERLGAEIDALRADPVRLAAVARAAHDLGDRHRSDTLIDLVLEVGGR
jgi:UDP-N-acetylglucosamine--N-acetylmuramyl-(pentapeptide) pyrophosphoryl-undecaprenol N-acetylglucosamine transferase